MTRCSLTVRGFCLAAMLAGVAGQAPAAELARLASDTWDQYTPRGKEVDAIEGDWVLTNGRLVAVIAQPTAGRNANMTVRNVGGCVIDLTRSDRQSDQLSAYYPGGAQMEWRSIEAQVTDKAEGGGPVERGRSVRVICKDAGSPARPSAKVVYTLEDGWDYLLVDTTYTNQTDQPLEFEPVDQVRADISFDKAADGQAPLFWVYDRWFGQAYALVAEGRTIESKSDDRTSTVKYLAEGKASVRLEPGQSIQLRRRLLAGANLLDVKAIANDLAGVEQVAYDLDVRDTAGNPLVDAEVAVQQGEEAYGSGRTDGSARLACRLPAGRFTAAVSAIGCPSRTVDLSGGEQSIELDEPGYVVAAVRNEQGGPIPCKLAFRGREGTEDPSFGHQSGEWGVRNLRYSENGSFRQPLAPGKYDVIVSHGTEHDAVFAQIAVSRGQETALEAVLVRSVQTPGWISADFHSHSSPSGDNTSSQLGRVLNLLCEQVEFAPCTEHNRLDTYQPHLARLNATHLVATCVGMELTGSPGDVNHQNAFPLVRKPRLQDGGAPQTDADPEVQIERLALWDGGSEKLLQQNHPDLGHLFFDKDGDGQPDGGFSKSFQFMDVIEVHPPQWILQGPTITFGTQVRNNTIFNWLQLLNQGHRIPGVVNTDAHYNFHGSGFLRVYLKSTTDDPAEIDTMQMVHAAEHGHVIMTSGPYMEVLLTADEIDPAAGGQQGPASEQDNTQAAGTSGTAGDDVQAPSGKATLRVRVQCPNWFDIDRVQVFLNGRPDEKLNFTRSETPERFTGGTIKFDQEIPLALQADTHVIVAAAGEKSTLGPVMGPDYGKHMPIAVSNPIYVDVDGGGFKPNGDTLGAPLPVMSGRARK
ncbi:MAG: CehA/McbA family metallohydrolase [Pirellulales bacterium]